ncbi:MAG: response regulator [Magnetococcales bacterium]|nr:response regulator [Magnetococcales bacterium]MBF0150553.1 response regulator [Magnetococcales bacterium]
MNDEPTTDNKIPLLLLGTNSRFNKRLAPCWPRWGYQAMMIEDGEKARAFLKTFSLELVLVDLAWSRREGHATLAMLKGFTGSVTTSVLGLILHNETAEEIREAVVAGVDDFFVMAGNLALLENRIHLLLETARSRRMMVTQEDRLNTILQRAADGIVTTDGSGIILAINSGAARIFGREEWEVVNEKADRLIPGISKYLLPVGDTFDGDAVAGYGIEGLGIHADGSRVSLHCSVARVRVDRAVRYSIIIRDLSALKEVENEYRKLANVLEYNPSMVMITNARGTIEYVNLKLTEVTGYPMEELVGHDQKILKSGLQDREFNETLWNTIHQGQVWRGEIQNRKRDGSLYWAWVNISPIRGPDGSIQQFVAISRDISAEKVMAEQMAQAQRERQETQAQMEAILNNMSSIVFLKDYLGRYLFINRSFEVFLGLAASQVLGKRARDLFGPELAIPMEEADREVLDRKRSVESEIVMVGADGERVFFMTRFPLAIGDNPTTVLCGIATDITKRKRMERELQVAKEQAEAANRAKSDFLANMSHEVRTPMNGVVGMLELLDRTELDSNQRHYLATAIKSAELQLAVINDILDFSKIEAGRLELEESPFDLTELVEETAAMLAERAHGKGLELAVYIDPDLPSRLTGDSLRLRQVLINLIANAIKFTEKGEVVVEVRREGSRQGEPMVVGFRISDTGIGMDPTVREKIFQPFTQADGSTTRKYGGTGLGLVISRQLVEAMGGGIEVESTPNRGSTFKFSIPFADSDHDGQGVIESLRNAHVLIVDDNETNRSILESYFKSWGVPYRSVDSGAKALALLRRQRDPGNRRAAFRVAILDFHMPGMDGLELARAIRHDPDIPPVNLMLFSSGMQPGREELRLAGIDLCIMKPAGKAKILDGMASLIKSRGTAVRDKEPLAGEPGESRTRLQGRILLVEDTMINQQVALGMLRQLGLEVTLATNGAEAVALVQREVFDLVLMDVQMPVMDGLEAARAIRAMEAARGTVTALPIIAMTAHALEQDRRTCLQAGMDDHLPKPVRWDMLERMLTRWLGDGVWLGGDERKDPMVEQGIVDTAPVREVATMIDVKALDSLVMIFKNDPDQVKRLIHEYLVAVPRHLETMAAGLAGEGFNKAARAAHSMKSQSGYVGAVMLAALGREMESLTDTPEREDRARELLTRMQELWPEVRKGLEGWMGTLGGSGKVSDIPDGT